MTRNDESLPKTSQPSRGSGSRTSRFEVRQITISAAGIQRAVVDGQVTTRARKPYQTVSVMIGDLLIYCQDLA